MPATDSTAGTRIVSAADPRFNIKTCNWPIATRNRCASSSAIRPNAVAVAPAFVSMSPRMSARNLPAAPESDRATVVASTDPNRVCIASELPPVLRVTSAMNSEKPTACNPAALKSIPSSFARSDACFDGPRTAVIAARIPVTASVVAIPLLVSAAMVAAVHQR